jgi:hypothetical protein
VSRTGNERYGTFEERAVAPVLPNIKSTEATVIPAATVRRGDRPSMNGHCGVNTIDMSSM